MENYTVYVHIFPNNKKYFGITSKKVTERWKRGNGYCNNKHMKHAIDKYGWENIKHEILFENLTKEEAEQKEIELIAKYQTTKDENGYNKENGGNHNGKMTNKIKEKLSKSHLGYKMEEKTKLKISETLKGTRHGMAIIKMKPINMYDLDGNFIKSFDCMCDCQRELGVKKQNISLCCQGKRKSTHGYKFEYK